MANSNWLQTIAKDLASLQFLGNFTKKPTVYNIIDILKMLLAGQGIFQLSYWETS